MEASIVRTVNYFNVSDLADLRKINVYLQTSVQMFGGNQIKDLLFSFTFVLFLMFRHQNRNITTLKVIQHKQKKINSCVMSSS